MPDYNEMLQRLLSFPQPMRQLILDRDLPGFTLEVNGEGDINLLDTDKAIVATSHNL